MAKIDTSARNSSGVPRSPRQALLPLALAAALAASFAPSVSAQVATNQLPTGGAIAGGSGTLNPASGASQVITQTSNRMAVNWSTFDIGSDATVRFDQPSASAVVLNRVVGGNPTYINGRLDANGQVFVANSNGLLFGSTAQVNVGGLVATTLLPDVNQFMSGNDVLNAGGNTVALLSNQGALTAAAGGITLIGGKVVNTGTITATVGNINLVGADRATLTFESGGFGVVVDGALQLALDSFAIDNSGTLVAPGGRISLEARAMPGIFNQLINNSGTIRATALSGGSDGSVSLVANSASGLAIVGSGSIDVGAGSITYSTGSGVQQTGVLTAATLLSQTGGSASFTGNNRIADLGMVDAGGNLSLVNTIGLTQSGAVTVGGTSSFSMAGQSLQLGNSGNRFNGLVTLNSGATRIVDSGALRFGSLTTGALSATSTGELSLGAGTVNGTLTAVSNGGQIGQTGTLNVTGISTINAGAGDIALGNDNNDFTGAVSLTGGAVNVHDRNNLLVSSLTSGTDKAVDLFSNATLTVGAFAMDTGTGSLRLASNGGAFSTAGSVRGGTVSLRARDGIGIGHDVTADALILTTGNTAVNQTAGVISVAGTTTGVTGSGDLNMTGAGNNFRGRLNLTTGNVQINDIDGLSFGSLSTGALTATSGGALDLGSGRVQGNLVATSTGGGVTQTGGLTVTGTSTIASGSGSTTLNNGSNDFQGAVALSGNGVALQDATALTVSSVNAGTGSASIAALGGALNMAGPVTGGNVSLRARDALTLSGTLQAGGSLDLVSTTGAISQVSGSILAQGATSVSAAAGAGTILLLGVANDFSGVTSLVGDTVQVNDANALTLGALDTGALTVSSHGALNLGHGRVGGALTASSGGGSITQSSSGTLSVAGISDLDAGGGAITLLQLGNMFAGQVGLRGGDVTILTAGALRLGASDATSLRAYSGDSLTLAGTISADTVDLAGGSTFINTVGPGAIGPQARWRVYLQSPSANHAFNGLDSGNTAVWNTLAFGTTAPGNRYVFAYQPSLTVTSHDASKVYGQLADLSGLYTVSGWMPGVQGAYAADTLATATGGGLPSVFSAGAARTAGVRSDYVVEVGAGTLDTASSGYGLVFQNSGRLSVTPAALSITAGDLVKTYGDATVPTGFTVNGLVNGDSVSGVDLTSAGSVATATVGGYTIEASDADGTGLSNYTITYVDGLLTVGKADLVITANDASKTYGQGASLQGFTFGGLRNSDSVSDITLSSDGAGTNASVGRYRIQAADADGVGLSNYNITYADGVLTVGKVGLTIRANDASKTYGDVSNLAGFSADGLVNGDTVTGARLASDGAAGTANVGSYRISAGGADGDRLSNYDITYVDGVLSVGKAGLTITASDETKRYGTVALLEGFRASGLRNGDQVSTVALSSAGAPASASRGQYRIGAEAASGSGLSNYNVTYLDGTLSVVDAAAPSDTRAVASASRAAHDLTGPVPHGRPATESEYAVSGQGIALPAACTQLDSAGRSCDGGSTSRNGTTLNP